MRFRGGNIRSWKDSPGPTWLTGQDIDFKLTFSATIEDWQGNILKKKEGYWVSTKGTAPNFSRDHGRFSNGHVGFLPILLIVVLLCRRLLYGNNFNENE